MNVTVISDFLELVIIVPISTNALRSRRVTSMLPVTTLSDHMSASVMMDTPEMAHQELS